jgi:hypothetical protein
MTDQDDDERTLRLIGQKLEAELGLGIGSSRPDDVWRLSWVCGTCNHVHVLRGKLEPIQQASTAFMLWGYPFVCIENEAFATLRETGGQDDSAAELAEEYKAFLKT